MKIVLVYSGGLDSTVLLYKLLAEGHTVKALITDYDQKALHEIGCARSICKEVGVEHQVIDLKGLGPLLNSALTSEDQQMPLGHYSLESMKQTVVPNRNMIMLSIAAGWAISLKFDNIAYAAQAGDHQTYPDCREPFMQALDEVFQLADWHPVQLWRPFALKPKSTIVALGRELEVPFEKTWSCYQSVEVQCGICSSCIARREAFYLAGVEDPTLYQNSTFSKGTLIENN